MMPPSIPNSLTSALSDRLDGLALLADSLAEDTAVARSRELFRLIERAFRRGPADCIEPLATFLVGHPRHDALQYSKDEITHWLTQLRGEVVHADRRRTYARSPDVEPYLARMEFAGYDVLFNKEQWRHPSARRRHQQDFMSAVQKDGGGVAVLHPGATVAIDCIDPWNVFPVDFESHVRLTPEWIWRLPGLGEDSDDGPPVV